VKPFEIKTVLWVFVATLAALGALGFAGTSSRALASQTRLAAPLPSPPPVAVVSPQHYGASQNPEPASAGPASKPLSRDLTSSPKCPLGRVAMVRGGDSEAREGGGFYAARANGIHGAVDRDGFLGEPVFAVADGKVVVAVQSDLGKLGKTVVVDPTLAMKRSAVAMPDWLTDSCNSRLNLRIHWRGLGAFVPDQCDRRPTPTSRNRW
jgi:hypothetical protein